VPFDAASKYDQCKVCRGFGRPAEARLVREPKRCTGCGVVLSARAKKPTCLACRPQPETKPSWREVGRQCDDCGRRMRYADRYSSCLQCRVRAGLKPARMCGCGRRIRQRKGQPEAVACWTCRRPEIDAMRAGASVCAREGCGRRLRKGRAAGLCGPCSGDAASRRTLRERTARYRAKVMAAAGATCDVCGVAIAPETKTGRCLKHAAGVRANRTILHAHSADELEYDRAWAKLPVAAKSLVLVLAEAGA
jgi:hypothetical protein